jgi:alpha-L-arabinofuranosidase
MLIGKLASRKTRTLLRTRIALAVCVPLAVGGLTAGVPVAAADTAPALAGHWTLDEGTGTTAADSSGNGNTGTLGAGASWAPGQVGPHAVAVNGSGAGNIDIPKPVVDTSRSFTVSAWIKLNNVNGYQTAVSIDGVNISGFFLQLSAVTGSFAFTRRTADSVNSTEVRADASITPAANTWYHVVGVNDATAGMLRIYVDGLEGNDAAFTSNWQATGHTMIGRGKFGGPVDFVNGAVDDVSMYQTALTSAQVDALDQGAHWPYDEGSGVTAADSSGNGHTGTLGSGASWTTGRFGGHAVALDGTTAGNITSAGPTVDTGHSFSVAAWAKFNSTNGPQDIVSAAGGATSGYELQLRGDGKLAFSRPASDSASATVVSVADTAVVRANTWYHLVGVDDTGAGKLLLYVNGLLVGSTPYTAAWPASGDTVVGAGHGGGFLGGVVDDVYVADYAMPVELVDTIVGPAGGTLDVNAGTPLHALPATFFGLMTEDINHSMTGGLYPEMVNNRSMMADATNPVDWSAVGGSAVSLDPGNPLNTALSRSLKVSIQSAGPAGVANDGYWGFPVRPRQVYHASLFAKATAGFRGPVTLSVESPDGSQLYASGRIRGIGTGWRQFTATLVAGARVPTTADARYVLSTSGNAGQTLWLDNVSLFPPTYDNVANGLRIDLMRKFAALKPAFIREPGGNYLEGNTIDTRFNWKNTIGPVWTRPGHLDDAWGYWSTDGMGLLEYLEWCEQLGAKPLLAVYAGYSLNGSRVPQDQLQPYVQDALDEIQYATGSVNTTWGRQRALDGHPRPFDVQYVEVGNEDFFDRSGSYDGYRFPMFYDAIKQAYPGIKVVATTNVTSRTPDIVDQHFYESPAWMNSHAGMYDGQSRSGPKIMVGEWASQEGSPTPDLNAALGDASWLTGLERNSDLVTQEAYAPMLVNVNNVAWRTNLIGFDPLVSYGSPSYWVQVMMANGHGDQVLGASYAGVGGINVVASRDSRTGRIYVTIVNPGRNSQPVDVDISGGGERVSRWGTVTVLSSAHPGDTNTIAQPGNVVPKTVRVGGLGRQFTRTVPAYSVTVLTLG